MIVGFRSEEWYCQKSITRVQSTDGDDIKKVTNGSRIVQIMGTQRAIKLICGVADCLGGLKMPSEVRKASRPAVGGEHTNQKAKYGTILE